MAEPEPQLTTEIINIAAIAKAHEQANREALLERARQGKSIPEWRDGKLVEVTPAEIFARFGLDANGNPKPAGG